METNTFKCTNCGGELEFNPGVQSLTCPFCGTINENQEAQPPTVHEELDFESALTNFRNAPDTIEVQIVKCTACGAEVTIKPNITTASCEYCGTNIVASGKGQKVMKPQYLLPFRLKKGEASASFRKWIRKRWFAPNALKKIARISEPLKGVYFPYWTYDSETESTYQGERGVHYQVQVQTTDSDGKTVTRSETRTRWSSVSGRVQRFFDDVLIPASRSLKEKLTRRLDEWNLKEMIDYDEKYLPGFKAESYSVDLEEGFAAAKDVMSNTIRQDIRRDIGGDEQRIHSVNTRYSEITFKYILLPIWVLMYKFKKKYFQVLINANTGEIEGERPFSWIKITLFVLFILAIGAGVLFLFTWLNQGG
jgi:predicted RNA-binding Zn-ribbon protein involved in translation (DUF1610 family)